MSFLPVVNTRSIEPNSSTLPVLKKPRLMTCKIYSVAIAIFIGIVALPIITGGSAVTLTFGYVIIIGGGAFSFHRLLCAKPPQQENINPIVVASSPLVSVVAEPQVTANLEQEIKEAKSGTEEPLDAAQRLLCAKPPQQENINPIVALVPVVSVVIEPHTASLEQDANSSIEAQAPIVVSVHATEEKFGEPVSNPREQLSLNSSRRVIAEEEAVAKGQAVEEPSERESQVSPIFSLLQSPVEAMKAELSPKHNPVEPVKPPQNEEKSKMEEDKEVEGKTEKDSVDELSLILKELYNAHLIKQALITKMFSHFGPIFTRQFSTFLQKCSFEGASHTLSSDIFSLKQKKSQKTKVDWLKGNSKGATTQLLIEKTVTLTFVSLAGKPVINLTGVSISSEKRLVPGSVTAKLNAIVFDPLDNSFSLHRSTVTLIEKRVASGIREGCVANGNIDFTPSEDTLELHFKGNPNGITPSPTWTN